MREDGPRYSVAGIFVATAFGVALLALIGEAGLRILGYSGMNPKPWDFFVYDPLLGWTNAPGVEAEFSGPRPWPLEYRNRVAINSLGLRGPEPTPGDSEALRVLAIGDSLTAAFEVPYADSFATRLEDKLSERLGVRTRVLNGGVRGYGIDQTYLRYREHLRQLEPHVVLLTITWNDAVDNVTLHNMGRPFAKGAFVIDGDGELRPVGTPVPVYPSCSLHRLNDRFEIEEVTRTSGWLLCRAREIFLDHSALLTFVSVMGQELSAFARRAIVGGEGHRELAADGRVGHALHLTNRLLLAIAEVAHRDGASLVIAGHSEHLGPLDLAPLERIGVTMVELDGVYSDDPTSVRFQHDPHWNAKGHERAAQILAPVLAESLRVHLPARNPR